MAQERFQVKNTEMQMVSVNSSQIAGLNDKRYDFSDGIVYFSYDHLQILPIREEKKEFKEKFIKLFNIKSLIC